MCTAAARVPPILLALVSMFTAGHAASQTTTTFNVTGSILPGVCRIAVADVNLGTYQATLFTGAYTTPFQTVNVVVSQCDPLVTRVALRFDGIADTSNAQLFQGGLASASSCSTPAAGSASPLAERPRWPRPRRRTHSAHASCRAGQRYRPVRSADQSR